MAPTLDKRAAAEAIGTAFLLTAIIGSGIMAERLAGGNVAIALLANTIATGAALATLILTFAPISGAHFNPLVTAAEWIGGRMPPAAAGAYVLAQLTGALAGAALAHAMFGVPLYAWSTHVRSGVPQALSEAVATFGLLLVVLGGSARASAFTPFAIAAYITSAYWFTASTSFANPAVTIARSITDTFAGIRPADVPLFLGGQMAGAVLAIACARWLWAGAGAAPARTV